MPRLSYRVTCTVCAMPDRLPMAACVPVPALMPAHVQSAQKRGTYNVKEANPRAD
jgi:hypothetical protein